MLRSQDDVDRQIAAALAAGRCSACDGPVESERTEQGVHMCAKCASELGRSTTTADLVRIGALAPNGKEWLFEEPGDDEDEFVFTLLDE